jgi:hypothetical protein
LRSFHGSNSSLTDRRLGRCVNVPISITLLAEAATSGWGLRPGFGGIEGLGRIGQISPQSGTHGVPSILQGCFTQPSRGSSRCRIRALREGGRRRLRVATKR